jgi:hypothetical protein
MGWVYYFSGVMAFMAFMAFFRGFSSRQGYGVMDLARRANVKISDQFS